MPCNIDLLPGAPQRCGVAAHQRACQAVNMPISWHADWVDSPCCTITTTNRTPIILAHSCGVATHRRVSQLYMLPSTINSMANPLSLPHPIHKNLSNYLFLLNNSSQKVILAIRVFSLNFNISGIFHTEIFNVSSSLKSAYSGHSCSTCFQHSKGAPQLHAGFSASALL